VTDLAAATVEVTNRFGVHVRPSIAITRVAIQFRSRITIACGDRSADAHSAVALAALGADRGDLVTITARGSDAKDALAAIRKLFEDQLVRSS